MGCPAPISTCREMRFVLLGVVLLMAAAVPALSFSPCFFGVPAFQKSQGSKAYARGCSPLVGPTRIAGRSVSNCRTNRDSLLKGLCAQQEGKGGGKGFGGGGDEERDRQKKQALANLKKRLSEWRLFSAPPLSLPAPVPPCLSHEVICISRPLNNQ